MGLMNSVSKFIKHEKKFDAESELDKLEAGKSDPDKLSDEQKARVMEVQEHRRIETAKNRHQREQYDEMVKQNRVM